MKINEVKTLGDLKKHGYKTRTVKEEIRENLIKNIRSQTSSFNGIIGYEDSVIPDVERAILSRHNMLFLGLRGQAKTRMAREIVNLLDEYIPVIEGSEIQDDPFHPISAMGRKLLREQGDATPITWVHRSERFGEKLATPDVSVADLIGDIDPIKAANLKLSFADEEVIHYGIVPRSNRGIFVINELPDLQARIQVALFNILQEGDIQIRGFKLRMPLDILFIFTANPEDYTNRGSIVTPLKDRIESQIITHYPRSVMLSKEITKQEANILDVQKDLVEIPDLGMMLIEHLAMEARKSEFVDQKSGVSARLTISAYENLVSSVERRAIMEGAKEKVMLRMADLIGIIPAITGKIELVYEGELEGPANVAIKLLGLAIRTTFLLYFPDPNTFKSAGKEKPNKRKNPYQAIIDWYSKGNETIILQSTTPEVYRQKLYEVDGLHGAIQQYYPNADEAQSLLLMEFLLHGLSEFSLISKKGVTGNGFSFGDLLGGMLNINFDAEEDDFG